MYTNYILIGIVLFVLLYIFIYRACTKSKKKICEGLSDIELTNTIKVTNYYSSTCSISQAFAPTWDQIMEKYNVTGSGVEADMVQCNLNDTNGLTCYYAGVTGYPQIKAVVCGQRYSFTGSRTFDNLTTWIDNLCKYRVNDE